MTVMATLMVASMEANQLHLLMKTTVVKILEYLPLEYPPE
jgi:hypothetical protein